MKPAWFFLILVPACLFCFPNYSPAVSPEDESIENRQDPQASGSLQQELRDGFKYTFRVLGYGIARDPTVSPLTFGREDRFDLARYQFESDFRPDLWLKFRDLDISVKPRFEYKWKDWEEGSRNGQSDDKGYAYVNEYLVRYMPIQNVFVSYGRENLQWGPSYLISPSNPFIRNNGKNNPKIEVRGMDFARAVWVPSYEWSVSAISSIDEGAQDFIEGFHKSYAAKIDYTGDRKFFSLIPQYTDDGCFKFGYYGGWSVTDALILHTEGRIYDHPEVLVGGSYTLSAGPTLTAEYYHNGAGSTREPIYFVFPPIGDVNPDSGLFRENYVLLQLMHNKIRDVFSITLRWIADVDDGSSRSVAILEYSIGEHIELFTIGDFYSGSKGDEFGSLYKFSVFSGIQYTF
jgi:hypothetical protein